jgi:hypothetical protein
MRSVATRENGRAPTFLRLEKRKTRPFDPKTGFTDATHIQVTSDLETR